MDTFKKELNRLDLEEGESPFLTDQEIATYRMGKQRLREIAKFKKMDLQQKSKIKCLVDGDENSRLRITTAKIKFMG